MSFLRTLQSSARARYAVYAIAGAGTYYGVHKYHQSRKPVAPHAAKVDSHAGKGPSLKEGEAVITKKVKEAEETKPSSATSDAKLSLTEEAEAALGDSSEGEKNTGAFDPVTGEINWDCPCLGGMAHGPCGPQFREAFSCFVHSEGEPKGIDCVERFRDMQECFRAHPEVYAEELRDDDKGPDLEPPSSSNTSSDGVPPPTGGVGLPKPSLSDPPTHGDDIRVPPGDVLPTPEGGIKPLPDPNPQPPPLPGSEEPNGPPPTPAGDPRHPPPGRPRGDPRKQPTGVPRPRPRPTSVIDPAPRPVGTGIGGTEVANIEIEKA